MKIAHVITRMIIGGAQENTLFNCQDLVAEHGDEVLLVCGPETGPEGDLLGISESSRVPAKQVPAKQGSAKQKPPEQGRAGRLTHSADGGLAFEIDGVQVRILDSLRRAIHPMHDWRAAGELRQAIRDFRPDVVHTHSAKGGLLGRHIAWGLKVPAVIHTVHGAPFHDYQSAAARRFFIGCERWAAKRCHHLISVADAMTDLMVDAGVAPRDKFTTISSGMDVEPFLHARQHRERVRATYGIEDEHVVVGKIARLFHLKGHADLVNAARIVADRHPNVRFLLVGDGILRDPLTRQITDAGLTDHFIFTGLVPPTQVPELIGAMDLLVHASYREGLARALPQALISGIPAISYDIDGAREVVINDETGYLVEPSDVSGMAERISQLVGDAGLRERQGRAGQMRFTDQFRHQTMTDRIRDLYKDVLAKS
ncbi:Glycosyltransferase involved in cell wall bisynthesis [Neorhodopirellula lusitana]|uniref:Glycosyltransferase involved in cell wall bisynthesis n=1 Tax=Neorhodopirellula lusitana TaxID=445327 RepID=A0ABY1Q0X0_9BACT|nr:glycosyltransferase family 4 protein [Neorhodopirellula lusitana]SMP51239.1 Glycosyltransferase involved in cell wall bisynthesis [Neorhodopirellula lusitana]